MEGRVLALCLIKYVIFCSVTNVFRSLRYITRDDSYIKDEEEDEMACHNRERDMLSVEDAMIVMEILGRGEWRGGRWREGAGELLEEKEASTKEVKEVFCVFDWNKDGYITLVELWSVMRRLGIREGVRMEECVRMVSAFDEDGDGRISFLEFKRLLENAF